MNLMRPALSILSVFILLGIFPWITKQVCAAEYQNCDTNKNCSIGEFLYDDNYVPIATASCTITSRFPDGTLFLDSAAMSASASGWYSYSASIGSTEGIYPTQICCNATSDYLCLDKTFKVIPPATSVSGGATAAEVWSYSDRSLTSFGTLVSDIWNYSTRSLTNFGDLVSSIWSHDTRTLTSNETLSLANINDIKEIKKVVKENRLILEQLINKPIVKTFIDESPTPKLSDKLEQTKTAASNLYSGIQNLKSRSILLEEKWPTLTESEIESELSTLSFILKQDINQKDTNILSTTDWLKKSWNSPILLNLSDQAQGAQSQIGNLLNDITLYGKTANPKSLASAFSHIRKLDELVGTSLASSDDLTLYGFIKKTTDQVAYLDQKTAEGRNILTQIKKEPQADHQTAINTYETSILASNQLPQVDSFFIKSLKKTTTPTNKVLGLMAIVDTNRLLLAANTSQTIKNIWLEEGSIIFRSVAINPSHSISQKVTVKYYLPTELKKEQIIMYDPELKIDYDPIENALFASGEISLAPDETKTFLVEVEDIWSFRQEEIDSLKNQVNELTNALKNTSQFTQAIAIKSDIVVSLDKIMLRQNEAITPENHIQTYRESALEMNSVEEKITALKELLVRSNTSSGFLGSLGGVHTVTVWGIVLTIIAGIVFLAIYLNALRTDARTKKEDQNYVLANNLEEHDNIYHPNIKYKHRDTGHHKARRVARIVSVALLTSGLGSIGISLAIKAGQDRPTALVSPAPDAVVLGTNIENVFPYETSLKLPDSGVVPVRSSPAITAPEVMSLKDVDKIYVFKIVSDWAQIGLSDKDEDKNWWLNTHYLVQK